MDRGGGDRDRRPAARAGIVVTVPVDGHGRMDGCRGGRTAYDMALVTAVGQPVPVGVRRGGTRTAIGHTGARRQPELEQALDDPDVDQLFLQAAQELNPVDGGKIYTQIDDQLWDQMVALPLFGEPELIANGVQLANAGYNPSVDGILWNVAPLDPVEAGPAPNWVVRPGPRGMASERYRSCRSRRRYGPSREVGARATMPLAPVAISEPLRRSGGIGRRASLRG